MTSILGALGRLFSRKPRASRQVPFQRPAAFESLEPRNLLAGDVPASITGLAFVDLTDNGLTSDDQMLAGATIQLYRDSGDGAFDATAGDDVLIASAVTNDQGRYRVDGLVPGRYYVEQSAQPSLLQRDASSVQTVVISEADMAGALQEPIDTFETFQRLEVWAPNNRRESSAIAAGDAIGGERDMLVELTTDFGILQLSTNYGMPVLQFDSSAAGDGRRLVTWDGADGNGETIDYRGLGGYDLTADGTITGIQFAVGADHATGQMILRVYSDGDNWSQAVVDIPATGGLSSSPVDLPLSELEIGDGLGADFENVGAIQLEIIGDKAIDGQIDRIDTYGPTSIRADFANLQPLSLGNTVWFDADPDGIYDAATESGIAQVLLKLYEDTDASGALTDGVDTLVASQTTSADGTYQFDQLLPGSYIVQVDSDNFTPGGALEGLAVSDGGLTASDPDNDTDGDNNGRLVNPHGVVAQAVTLAHGTEPTGDGDADDNSNLTVDFGFTLFDLSLTKTDDADPVVAGETLTYSLQITNNGPADAADVTVVDPLPNGITLVSVTTSQGSHTTSGNVVRGSLGDLASGALADITIQVKVDEDYSGELLNEAVVSGRRSTVNPVENDPWTEVYLANNRDQITTEVVPQIDLAVSKLDSPDPVVAGTELSYEITVVNNGPSTATGVTLTDELPAGVQFRSVSTSHGLANHVDGVLTIDIGSLTPGEIATVLLQVDVDSGAPDTLVNPVRVTADQTDTNPDNDVDEQITLVRGVFDLQIAKTDFPDPILAGEELVYTLLVTNNGPSDADLVTVIDDLPDEVAFVSAETTKGSVEHVAGRVTGRLGYLTVGQSETITIVTEVSPEVVGQIDNVAIVEGSPAQVNPLLTGQFLTELNVDNNMDEQPTMVEAVRSTISGYVYVDFENNGIRDPDDLPIPGVEVSLDGTDVLGNSVHLVDVTDDAGAYLFEDLIPGSYSVSESQPASYADGKESPGRLRGINEPLTFNVQDDVFADIGLAGGVDAIEFNFGELSLIYSKRDFLSSSPEINIYAQTVK